MRAMLSAANDRETIDGHMKSGRLCVIVFVTRERYLIREFREAMRPREEKWGLTVRDFVQ